MSNMIANVPAHIAARIAARQQAGTKSSVASAIVSDGISIPRISIRAGRYRLNEEGAGWTATNWPWMWVDSSVIRTPLSAQIPFSSSQ